MITIRKDRGESALAAVDLKLKDLQMLKLNEKLATLRAQKAATKE